VRSGRRRGWKPAIASVRAPSYPVAQDDETWPRLVRGFFIPRNLCQICNQIAPVVWYGIARRREGGLQEAGLLELLTIQPARIMMGATVFMMGILSGVGIAMWIMPPV
jgi:hypothetical protein